MKHRTCKVAFYFCDAELRPHGEAQRITIAGGMKACFDWVDKQEKPIRVVLMEVE